MAKKRVNGSGSVSELADGRFLARAFIDGKRVCRYRDTRLEADLVLAGLLTGTEPPQAKRRFAAPPLKEGKTLRGWSGEWLNGVIAS